MAEPTNRCRISRRRFLLSGLGTLALTAGSFGYAWWIEPHWVKVVRRELPIARLPQALLGKTLVQISDLHVGPVVDAGYITRAVAQASPLEPDSLVITGGFMTCRRD